MVAHPSTSVPEANIPTKLSQQYMPALTGIRAIAAYMVCFFHYNPFEHIPHTSGWQQIAFGIFNELHTGVTIFFVLSGFLICYRYYENTTRITWPWFKRYFRNRFARIYPMYFLLTLLAFGLIEWNGSQYELVHVYSSQPPSVRLIIFIQNITLLKGFFNDYKFSGLAQGWSLTVEECFYACAPFIILSFKRNRWSFITLPIITLLIGWSLWKVFGGLNFSGLFGSPFFVLNFTFFGRCLEFFIGMGLAVFMLRQRHQHNGLLPARRGYWLTCISIAAFSAAIVVMAVVYTHPALINVTDPIDINRNSKDSYFGIAINNVALPVFTAMLFYGLLTERTWLRSLLSSKLLDLLGKSSYIFYLIHMGVVNILLRTYVAHNSIVQFMLLNVLSVILYKYVESPLHRWLKPKS
jgi:peptidoglycan/LPS O-acetylase OafA/YrhL